MNVICEYCGNQISDTEAKCPICGGVNRLVKRSVSDQPLTIEEFKEWYRSKGLPPYEVTRFFIGEDYKEPKAFGIYKDSVTGKVTVYMNASNGERKVRYEGFDETYGVNELYQRLKQEIIEQKELALKKRRGIK